MQISPAIVRLFLTISSGGRSVFSSSARAADWAKAPPEPMAAMPSSGSSTSPLPVMMSECSRSATTSMASRRLSMRSVRQSLASSTALRMRWPECLSSLASKRSNRVKASAVPPANPASTFSWYRRRTLRAVALITILPSVTWPSPPSATSPPRRTERMVVPRYCSMRRIIDEATSWIAAGAIRAQRSVWVVRDELHQLVDAHDAEKFVDEGVMAAQKDRLAAAQALHQHADELANAGVIDAGDTRQVDQHFVVDSGMADELLQRAIMARADFSGESQRVILRLGRSGLHHFGGTHLAPGRRRHFEVNGVIDREILEVFLQAQRLIQLQKQQPVHGAAMGDPIEILQQRDELVDAADPQLAFGLASGAENADAFVCTRFVDHCDAREVDLHHIVFRRGGNAFA